MTSDWFELNLERYEPIEQLGLAIKPPFCGNVVSTIDVLAFEQPESE
jgi:hypothetical protein